VVFVLSKPFVRIFKAIFLVVFGQQDKRTAEMNPTED